MIAINAVFSSIALISLLLPVSASAATLYTESLSYGLSSDSGTQFTESNGDISVPEKLQLGERFLGSGSDAVFLGLAQTTGGTTLSASAELFFSVNCGSLNCNSNASAIAVINFDLGVLFTGTGVPTTAVPVLFNYLMSTDLRRDFVTGNGIGGLSVQSEIDLNGDGGVSLGPSVPLGEIIVQDTISVDLVPGETNTLTAGAFVFAGWTTVTPSSSFTQTATALVSVSVMLDPNFESDYDLFLDPAADIVNPDFDPDFSPVIPLPPAVWLFGSGIISLIGFARMKNV